MFCPVPYALPDKQLCFVHIPKTAGSALKYQMQRVYGIDDMYPHIFMKDMLTLPSGQMQKYRFIGAHLRCNIRDYLDEEPIYFTILRDPVERVISHFRFLRTRTNPPYGIAADPNLTLEEFLHNEAHRFRVDNHQTVYLGTDLILENKPEGYEQFPVITEEIFQRAKDNLDSFLFVGIQEHFQESMNVLCRLLGWPAYRTNRKINVTPKNGQHEVLIPELIEEIRERNQYDLALYDYGMELFKKKLAEFTYESTIEDEADRFYRVTFNQQYPASHHFTYDFRYTLINSNWHPASQTEQGIVFRHMGPGNHSFVDLPLKNDKDLILTFDILSSPTKDILDSLKVSINGVTIACNYTTDQQSVYHFSGTINKDILVKNNGRVRIRFSVDHTISLKQLGLSEDARPVGPAFSQIKVYPAEVATSQQTDIASLPPFLQSVLAKIRQHLPKS